MGVKLIMFYRILIKHYEISVLLFEIINLISWPGFSFSSLFCMVLSWEKKYRKKFVETSLIKEKSFKNYKIYKIGSHTQLPQNVVFYVFSLLFETIDRLSMVGILSLPFEVHCIGGFASHVYFHSIPATILVNVFLIWVTYTSI